MMLIQETIPSNACLVQGHNGSFSSLLFFLPVVQQISIVVSIQITHNDWLPLQKEFLLDLKKSVVFYHTRAYPYEDSVQINKG
jgi:hypothetical protein